MQLTAGVWYVICDNGLLASWPITLVSIEMGLPTMKNSAITRRRWSFSLARAVALVSSALLMSMHVGAQEQADNAAASDTQRPWRWAPADWK